MPWHQIYDPFDNMVISTIFAALPVVVLLGTLAFLHIKAHWAALLGLITALVVAIVFFKMPAGMAFATAGFGAAFGVLPIGWIVLNVIFLYFLTKEKGEFKVLQETITGVTNDTRLQLVLIAFAFGAFFEGAAGFGTPVAVTAAILIGLGFSPLQASGLSLLANTAPVAFGALGIPIITLNAVTGLDLLDLSAMAGRQLPIFSILIPFWLVWAYVGFRGMVQVWPALLVAGISFAVPQFLISNFHGPWLVDVVAALSCLAAVTVFLLKWRPKQIWGLNGHDEEAICRACHGYSTNQVVRAWTPWIILSVLVFIWGLPQIKTFLDGLWVYKFPIPGLNNLVNESSAGCNCGKTRGCCLCFQYPVRYGNRYFHSQYNICHIDGVLDIRNIPDISPNDQNGAFFPFDHCSHAGAGIHDQVLGIGRDPRINLC